jgi:hypothetical protein
LIKKFNGNNLRSIRYIGCPQDNIQDVTCSGASTAVRTITLTNTGNIADDYTYNSSTDNNFVERIYYNSNGMPSYNIELSSGKITSGSPYGGLHINSGGISMGNGSGSVMSSSSGGVNGELMFRSLHGMVYITTNFVHLLRTNSSSTSTSEWTGGFSYYPNGHSFRIGSYSDSNQQLSGQPANTYLAFCGRSVQLSGGSSERFKHDIKDLVSEGLNPHKLLFLKPKQFIYNDDYPIEYMDMKDKLIPGFIAEDVAEIYPSALIHDELDGTIKNWDVRRIVPGMLSLIQELYEKIEDLERRL